MAKPDKVPPLQKHENAEQTVDIRILDNPSAESWYRVDVKATEVVNGGIRYVKNASGDFEKATT